jgi:5-formyltetrahydrofolate cyclo-ligase
MTGRPVDEAKRSARERIWTLLDRSGVRVDEGRESIPDFVGADAAAARLGAVPQWRQASTVKANPDRSQLPVRLLALREGRTVFMAVPAMASPEPFFRLDPAVLGDDLAAAVDGRTAGLVAPTVAVEAVGPIDVVVCGSLAVDRRGVRLGKGAGYSDLEIALLTEAGMITSRTVVITTVHPLQVVDEPLPYSEHDVRVHYIVTPDEVVECAAPEVSAALDWSLLTSEKVKSIPVLQAQREV